MFDRNELEFILDTLRWCKEEHPLPTLNQQDYEEELINKITNMLDDMDFEDYVKEEWPNKSLTLNIEFSIEDKED